MSDDNGDAVDAERNRDKTAPFGKAVTALTTGDAVDAAVMAYGLVSYEAGKKGTPEDGLPELAAVRAAVERAIADAVRARPKHQDECETCYMNRLVRESERQRGGAG